MSPEDYTKYLAEYVYNRGYQTGDKILNISVKKDNSEYHLDDLNGEQQLIVICALESVMKFLTNDPTYKPLRATVVGCGGTGKSFIINTLISLVRKFTSLNDSVKVATPTGGAAYNIGGCTLHCCLNLSVDAEKLATDLSDEQQAKLAEQLHHLLMLVIDERSMISSALIAATERNVRHCVFGRQNQNELWGGIPVVLIFGDDYQYCYLWQQKVQLQGMPK